MVLGHGLSFGTLGDGLRRGFAWTADRRHRPLQIREKRRERSRFSRYGLNSGGVVSGMSSVLTSLTDLITRTSLTPPE